MPRSRSHRLKGRGLSLALPYRAGRHRKGGTHKKACDRVGSLVSGRWTAAAKASTAGRALDAATGAPN